MAAARSLAQFQKAFADEVSCAAFMFNWRWSDGFVCPACGKGRFAVLKSRPRLYECVDCGRQTSITAGTAMHRSKLPLTTWFWAAHLMTTHSNGMSQWRDRVLEARMSALKEQERDARDDEIARLRAKVGDITMDNQLL